MKALLIRKEPLDLILAHKKTWEIRGSRTAIRGPIALIESRSGTVVGICELIDCKGPLAAAEFRRNASKAGLNPSEAKLGYYTETFAWVLKNARRLPKPVRYEHPSGAVIWVNLAPSVVRAIRTQK